jgi:hypothetical protein
MNSWSNPSLKLGRSSWQFAVYLRDENGKGMDEIFVEIFGEK